MGSVMDGQSFSNGGFIKENRRDGKGKKSKVPAAEYSCNKERGKIRSELTAEQRLKIHLLEESIQARRLQLLLLCAPGASAAVALINCRVPSLL